MTSRSGEPTACRASPFAPGSPANLTIDSCTDTETPGVLTVITEGPVARQIGELAADERPSHLVATPAQPDRG